MTRYLLLSWQLRFCFLWGALSDERPGLSFIYAAGPRQRSLSWVRVPWYSRPYFTVSDLRLPISSPLTTRRVTVEVFDPASTRGYITQSPPPAPSYKLSLYTLGTDHTENARHVSGCVFIGPLPALGMARITMKISLPLSECVSIGRLPSTGHGADHTENISAVVRMRVHWPVAKHWARRGPRRKHFFQYIFYCCVRVFRPLPRNGSTRHNTSVSLWMIRRWGTTLSLK
jgi:hypothetical protein